MSTQQSIYYSTTLRVAPNFVGMGSRDASPISYQRVAYCLGVESGVQLHIAK
jgi:hypothetical protein